jgi:hypothetical protein
VDGQRDDCLGLFWCRQRPITGEELQAEMEQMAHQSKQPEVLLFFESVAISEICGSPQSALWLQPS